jgi:hypothetical protein
MDSFFKKGVAALLFIVSIALFASLHAQDAEVRTPAPEFSMYQYKDKVFDTDTVYGKKIVTFVFGSIT